MERLANAILGIIHPDLHQAGLAANVAYKDHMASCQPSNWTSAYLGMDVIVNRITPLHRDASGASSSYDLLISLDKGYKAKLCVTDIGAQFAYHPGTLVFLCGKVLEHSVPAWEGGERVVIAHYMKDLLHDRMGFPCPNLPSQTFWWKQFGSGQ